MSASVVIHGRVMEVMKQVNYLYGRLEKWMVKSSLGKLLITIPSCLKLFVWFCLAYLHIETDSS
jgi:hypothetical protein